MHSTNTKFISEKHIFPKYNVCGLQHDRPPVYWDVSYRNPTNPTTYKYLYGSVHCPVILTCKILCLHMWLS